MGLQYGGDYSGMRKISVQDLFRSDKDMAISRTWIRDPFWYNFGMINYQRGSLQLVLLWFPIFIASFLIHGTFVLRNHLLFTVLIFNYPTAQTRHPG